MKTVWLICLFSLLACHDKTNLEDTNYLEKINLSVALTGTWIPQEMYANLKDSVSRNDREKMIIEGVILKLDINKHSIDINFKYYERQGIFKAYIDTITFDSGKITLYSKSLLSYKRNMTYDVRKRLLCFDLANQSIQFDTGSFPDLYGTPIFRKYSINELTGTSLLRNKIFNESIFKKQYLLFQPSSNIPDTVTPIIRDWNVQFPYGKEKFISLTFIHFDTDMSGKKKMFFWVAFNKENIPQEQKPYVGVLDKEGVLKIYKCTGNPMLVDNPQPCNAETENLYCTLVPFRPKDFTGYWGEDN